jgi:8-oxo-dGTP diphosphatase
VTRATINPVRDWMVAGGLVTSRDGGVLLVRNRRRDGSLDWSPPGGVIEISDGESVVDGLTREVEEETGITVTAWDGPLWRVETVAEGLGWRLSVEVHLATAWEGELAVGADPDGIVVDARFVHPDECGVHLHGAHPWVCEPLAAWLVGETEELWRYRLDGDTYGKTSVTRIP